MVLTRTIPAARSFGIKEKYTSFVLPFGATVNMDGTSVYLTVTAVAFTAALGLPVGWGVFVALSCQFYRRQWELPRLLVRVWC